MDAEDTSYDPAFRFLLTHDSYNPSRHRPQPKSPTVDEDPLQADVSSQFYQNFSPNAPAVLGSHLEAQERRGATAGSVHAMQSLPGLSYQLPAHGGHHLQALPPSSAIGSAHYIMDSQRSDREEGELSDADGPNNRVQVFDQTILSSNTVEASTRNTAHFQSNNDGDDITFRSASAFAQSNLPVKQSTSSQEQFQRERARALKFIKDLHDYGYGFKDLVASEDLDQNLLRGLYEELGLRLEELPSSLHISNSRHEDRIDPISKAEVQVTAEAPASFGSSPKPDGSGRISSPHDSTQSPSMNRESYIARLRAAKSTSQHQLQTAKSSAAKSTDSLPTSREGHVLKSPDSRGTAGHDLKISTSPRTRESEHSRQSKAMQVKLNQTVEFGGRQTTVDSETFDSPQPFPAQPTMTRSELLAAAKLKAQAAARKKAPNVDMTERVRERLQALKAAPTYVGNLVNAFPTINTSPSSRSSPPAATPRTDLDSENARPQSNTRQNHQPFVNQLSPLEASSAHPLPGLGLVRRSSSHTSSPTEAKAGPGHHRASSPRMDDSNQTTEPRFSLNQQFAPKDLLSASSEVTKGSTTSTNFASPAGSRPQSTPNFQSLRKRPVATDFDDAKPSKSLKHSFGQPPHHMDVEPIIIEASDDESDNDMSHEMMLDTGRQSFRTRFLSLNDKSQSSPAVSRQSSSGTKRPAVYDSNIPLKTQEEKILEMKRKIAEMEQRRKIVAASSTTIATPADENSIRPTVHADAVDMDSDAGGGAASTAFLLNADHTPDSQISLAESIPGSQVNSPVSKRSEHEMRKSAAVRRARMAQLRKEIEQLEDEDNLNEKGNVQNASLDNIPAIVDRSEPMLIDESENSEVNVADGDLPESKNSEFEFHISALTQADVDADNSGYGHRKISSDSNSQQNNMWEEHRRGDGQKETRQLDTSDGGELNDDDNETASMTEVQRQAQLATPLLISDYSEMTHKDARQPNNTSEDVRKEYLSTTESGEISETAEYSEDATSPDHHDTQDHSQFADSASGGEQESDKGSSGPASTNRTSNSLEPAVNANDTSLPFLMTQESELLSDYEPPEAMAVDTHRLGTGIVQDEDDEYEPPEASQFETGGTPVPLERPESNDSLGRERHESADIDIQNSVERSSEVHGSLKHAGGHQLQTNFLPASSSTVSSTEKVSHVPFSYS